MNNWRFKEIHKKMIEYSNKNKGVHIVYTIFNSVNIDSFKYPSQITQYTIEQSEHSKFNGYYKDGKFYPYSKEFVNKKTSPINNKKKLSIFTGG